MGRDYQQSFYPPNDRGYRLEFKNPPPQRFFLTHLPRDQERRQAIVNLIVMWETEGVISPFLEDQKFRGFYSCISLVGKATSGFWMVINFKCPEQIHSLQTIPDGKHLFCKESVITRSVHGNPGSSGILAKAGAYFRIQRVSIVQYLDYFFGLCPREREPCSGSAIDLADLLEIGVEGQSAKVLSDSLPEHVLVGLPNTQLPKRFFFRKKRF